MENKPETVSYFVYEGEMARAERHVRRWVLAFLIVFVALIVSNISWIVYESQFEDVVTVTQDTPNGNNNYIGRDGDITNGTTDYNKAQGAENGR